MGEGWEQKVQVMLQPWGWEPGEVDGKHHPWEDLGSGHSALPGKKLFSLPQ